MRDDRDETVEDRTDDRVDDAPLAVGFDTPAGGRRKRRRGLPGCLAVLVALAVVAGGLYFGVTRGMAFLEDQFATAEDYPGPGSGKVTFEVQQGDSATAIARELKDLGVVASVDAFVAEASDNPDASRIQVGFYTLKKEMSAADALDVLVDPANIVTTSVTVPEGLRVVDVVAILAKETGKPAARFQRVLDQPAQLGLPAYADGNPEGYLFPSTYSFGPKETPRSMLVAMVDRWKQAAADADLEAAAQRLGYSPAELMTVASLVEAEGRGDDMPKIARVIYNRLENPANGITNGLLQIDASVNYGAGNTLRAVPSSDDIAADTPYNTYTRPGLPPTPIEAPGDAALAAATNPAEGPWLFYVTVNLKTGQTKFTDDYDEFLQFKGELEDYCATESAGAC